MSARLVSITPDAEKQMAYCARVSNPKNQESENIAGLLRYCVRNRHWSVFEHAHVRRRRGAAHTGPRGAFGRKGHSGCF